MSKKKEIPEWIRKAASEIYNTCSTAETYVNPNWLGSRENEIAEVIAKHAPSYSAEDVERLVAVAGIVDMWLREEEFIGRRIEPRVSLRNALKPFQKEK